MLGRRPDGAALGGHGPARPAHACTCIRRLLPHRDHGDDPCEAHCPAKVTSARALAFPVPNRFQPAFSLNHPVNKYGRCGIRDAARTRWRGSAFGGRTARPPGRPRRRGRAGSAGWSVRRCSSETPIRLRSRNPVASPAASAPAPARPPTDPSTGPRRRGRRRCRGLTAPVRPPRPSPSPAPVRSPASTVAGLSVQDPRDWAECREAGLLEQWARVVT